LIFFGGILRDLPPVEKGVKFYVLMGLTYRFDIYIAIGREPTIYPCFMRLFFGTLGIGSGNFSHPFGHWEKMVQMGSGMALPSGT